MRGGKAKAWPCEHERGTCSGAEPMGPLGGTTVDAPDCSNIASEDTSFVLPVPQHRRDGQSYFTRTITRMARQ